MSPSTAPSTEPLPPGTPAPPFRLPSTDAAAHAPGESLPPEAMRSLEALAGAPAVLVFYPADFTPVCGDELAIFSEVLPDLERLGARVLGISVDSVWCHRAFAREKNLRITLLSDAQPKGEVSRRYRSYREAEGFSERALFVLDGEGKIFWSSCGAMELNPGVDGVLDALERLTGRSADDGVEEAPAPRPERSEEARP